jgi:PAS domain S-box-containing protein
MASREAGRTPATYAWLIVLAGGALASALYLAPSVEGLPLTLLDVFFPAVAVVGILVGIRWHRPARSRPWSLFALGMTTFLTNNVARLVFKLLYDEPLPTSYPDDLIQIAGYVLIVSALISLIYSRKGGDSDRTSLIDASIIVVGAGMVSWVFLIAPFAHDSTLPLSERVIRMVYPFANLVLLGVSVRLAVSKGARTMAFSLLLLAMLASLFSNTAILDIVNPDGAVAPKAWVNIGFFLAYIFSAAGALHPTMRELTDVATHEVQLSKTRLGLFFLASLMGPIAYTVQTLQGRRVDVPVILAGSLIIFGLVLIRMAGLASTLRAREQRFRSLVQNASDVFAILDDRGAPTYVSPANERVLGYKPAEIIGTSSFAKTHPDDLQLATEFFTDVLASPRELKRVLLRVAHKDGTWRWIEMNGTNLISDPSIGGIVTNFHDVTETKHAEDALRKSEARSRRLFEGSPLPMWVYDLETLAFVAVNDAAVEHYGYSRDEFMTMTIKDIRPPEEVTALLDNLQKPRQDFEMSGVWRHQVKGGRLIDVEIASHLVEFDGGEAVMVVAQDVTERNRIESEKESLELQLRQAQKLEAVGQLAGGIAHDFNNLLAVIINYAGFVRSDVEDDSTKEDVDEILSAADKAANLVRQLLAFSRREIIRPSVLDLNDVISDMQKMLRRTIKESIDLVVDLDGSPWHIEADRGQLEQVILNMVVNADAAMPHGGSLQIKTSRRVFDDNTAGARPEFDPGNYMCLSISDNGAGMSKETAAHIFEPFFTTKPIGEGTGLGLSTAYGIVKQAGGDISVYSEPGLGTTFNVFLPATDAAPAEEPVIEADGATYAGTETVLVVEDEAGVREIARRLLTTAGYKVLVASDPIAAQLIAQQHRDEIAVLLTDMIMPNLSGKELAESLRRSMPELKVVFMSGYTDQIVANHGVLEEGVVFLQKPFGPSELLPLMREVITGTGSENTGARPGAGHTVLIVDDDEPMREVLSLLLEANDFRVLGTAAGGKDAIDLARDLHPDLVLLDFLMPEMNGDVAAPLLRAASPGSRIFAFSAVLNESPSWADGFLSKEAIEDLPPVLGSFVSG